MVNTFDQLRTMQHKLEKAQEESMTYADSSNKNSALHCLRPGKSQDNPDPNDLDSLPMDWRIEYEERAAILEYDGGLTREDAEMQALTEIALRIKNAV